MEEASFMNATLQSFGYPERTIREYEHWVTLIRPVQLTLGSVIIAAKADVKSLGALRPEEMAELPSVIRSFESVLTDHFGATKFNYLALMMVDPNPHFHGIPRYHSPVTFHNLYFMDERFPKPPALDIVNHCPEATLDALLGYLRPWFAV
jgi:diadenosine tetraphosphate (Ap4A) HIT family hydrolase